MGLHRVSRVIVAVAACACTLTSCSGDKTSDNKKTAETGSAASDDVAVSPKLAVTAKKQWYLAELALPATNNSARDNNPGPAHFFLQVPQGGAPGSVIVRSGDHDMEAKHTWDGDKLTIPFPLFHTELSATRAADGTLTGTWTSQSRTWGKAALTFAARPIAEPTAAALRTDEYQDKPNGAFSGLWKLAMEDGAARLQLTVKPDGQALASFSFPSGAYLHLGGIAAGDKLRLSGFDGTSAYRITATLSDRTMQGNWAVGQDLGWRERFQGERVEQFDVHGGPRLIQGADNLALADFDVDKLAGKPTIVELAGSWCITCRFIAPFLVEMYRKYHDQGLHMVTLTYEFTDDEAYNKQAAENFKREYGIPWDVIAMMGELDDAADILPQTLEEMELGGFPYSIFLDPAGKVRAIHAGFPASAEDQAKAKAEYERDIQALLGAAAKKK